MSSLQLFSVPRALEPMKLDPEAARLAAEGTSFLALNRTPSAAARAVEFAEAQAPPGKLAVRETDPELRHSFGGPGAFDFRYKGVANPNAYASDSNIDFGSGRAGAAAAERMNASAKQVSAPPPPPRQMIFTEKEQGGFLNPPAEAYRTYGYQESAMWMPRGGGSRAAAEKTRVIDMDANQCAPGETMVNGFCFAGDKAKASCPPGWKYAADGRCHRVAQERADGSDGGVTERKCPPGWVMRGGVCVAPREGAAGYGFMRKVEAAGMRKAGEAAGMRRVEAAGGFMSLLAADARARAK